MREKTLGPCAVLWVHGRRAEAVGAAGMRSVLPVSSRPSLPLSWAPLHAPAPCGGGVGPLPSERGPHGADGRARGCFQATPAASCCHLDSEAEPGPLGPAPRAWGASPGLRRAGAAGRKAARLRVLGAWAAGLLILATGQCKMCKTSYRLELFYNLKSYADKKIDKHLWNKAYFSEIEFSEKHQTYLVLL